MYTKKLILASSLLVIGHSTLAGGAIVKKRAIKSEVDLETYNLKLGGSYFKAGYHGKIGYDDNATSSFNSSNQSEGGYVVNGADIAYYNDLNKDFSIDLNLNLSYKSWISGSDNLEDNLLMGLGAGDTFSFDWEISERTTLSFIERAAIELQDTQQIQQNTGATDQQFWRNDFGIQLYHDLDEEHGMGIKVGRKDYININNEDQYDYRQFEAYYIGLKYDIKAGQKLTLSPFFNYEDQDYEDFSDPTEEVSDGDIWQVGIGFQAIAKETLIYSGYLAYEEVSTDHNSLEQNAETDGDGIAVGFNVDHTISEKMYHILDLSYGRRISSARIVNYSEDFKADYGFYYEFNSKLTSGVGVNWYHSEDQSSAGEKYDLVSPRIEAKYTLSPKSELTAVYIHTDKSSDKDTEYDRNMLELGFVYKF